jgi:hypothetical protein
MKKSRGYKDLIVYQKAFELDADTENSETQVWIDFARGLANTSPTMKASN